MCVCVCGRGCRYIHPTLLTYYTHPSPFFLSSLPFPRLPLPTLSSLLSLLPTHTPCACLLPFHSLNPIVGRRYSLIAASLRIDTNGR